jgi:hypothetical protein
VPFPLARDPSSPIVIEYNHHRASKATDEGRLGSGATAGARVSPIGAGGALGSSNPAVVGGVIPAPLTSVAPTPPRLSSWVMSCIAIRRQASGGEGPEVWAPAGTPRSAEVVDDVGNVDGVAARLPSLGIIGIVPLPAAPPVAKSTRAVRGQVQDVAVRD